MKKLLFFNELIAQANDMAVWPFLAVRMPALTTKHF